VLLGKTVVFGATGCIALYKAVDVVSRLKKAGASVFVIMTRNATKLVAPITFRTISENPVVTEMFEEPKQWNVEHIALAERADLFMVCPATANIIGKVASGIADDFLSTTIMATTSPVLFVPAMNNHMYENPITQKNIKYLESLGYHFLEPDYGRLASGKYGKGRFPEADRIVKEAIALLVPERPLADRHVLVTAGPTREAADPVWFLSNGSSGKMGYAVAKEAVAMGAKVTLVTGPTSLAPPAGADVVKVVSAEEMRDQVLARYDTADIVVMAAAPVDYRPEQARDHKIKKTGETFELRLVKNPDILLELGGRKAHQVLVGFAGETEDLVKNAKEKLAKKNADMFVANNVSEAFGADENTVTFVYRDGSTEEMPPKPKTALARDILSRANGLRDKGR
jgi:phosphopantothenoylcysteine decarboxylase/phosphopantothenate--cysteine ligase